MFVRHSKELLFPLLSPGPVIYRQGSQAGAESQNKWWLLKSRRIWSRKRTLSWLGQATHPTVGRNPQGESRFARFPSLAEVRPAGRGSLPGSRHPSANAPGLRYIGLANRCTRSARVNPRRSGKINLLPIFSGFKELNFEKTAQLKNCSEKVLYNKQKSFSLHAICMWT